MMQMLQDASDALASGGGWQPPPAQNKTMGALPRFKLAAQKLNQGEKLVKGRVRMINIEKNQAFILSEEMYMITGKEVFCLLHLLESAEAGPGDHVVFFLHWTSQRFPAVKQPCLRFSAANGYALKGTYQQTDYESGVILSPDMYSVFKSDVYVDKNIAVTLTDGQPVAFNAYLTKDGTPNCFRPAM